MCPSWTHGSVASKKDQARIIFDETYNMVRQSPDLLEVVKKRKSDLYFKLTFSKFQPLGKNSDTLDGLNSHLVIMDELHSIFAAGAGAVTKLVSRSRSDMQRLFMPKYPYEYLARTPEDIASHSEKVLKFYEEKY